MKGSTALVLANNMFIAMKKIAPTLQTNKSKMDRYMTQLYWTWAKRSTEQYIQDQTRQELDEQEMAQPVIKFANIIFIAMKKIAPTVQMNKSINGQIKEEQDCTGHGLNEGQDSVYIIDWTRQGLYDG